MEPGWPKVLHSAMSRSNPAIHISWWCNKMSLVGVGEKEIDNWGLTQLCCYLQQLLVPVEVQPKARCWWGSSWRDG
jgi:hypothetical protein